MLPLFLLAFCIAVSSGRPNAACSPDVLEQMITYYREQMIIAQGNEKQAQSTLDALYTALVNYELMSAGTITPDEFEAAKNLIAPFGIAGSEGKTSQQEYAGFRLDDNFHFAMQLVDTWCDEFDFTFDVCNATKTGIEASDSGMKNDGTQGTRALYNNQQTGYVTMYKTLWTKNADGTKAHILFSAGEYNLSVKPKTIATPHESTSTHCRHFWFFYTSCHTETFTYWTIEEQNLSDEEQLAISHYYDYSLTQQFAQKFAPEIERVRQQVASANESVGIFHKEVIMYEAKMNSYIDKCLKCPGCVPPTGDALKKRYAEMCMQRYNVVD